MSDSVEKQLHVFHDPFSNATSQPKIPDGSTHSSLGMTTQAVTEVVNSTSSTTMHMLLFAGQNAGLVLSDSTTTGPGTGFYVQGFADMGGPSWVTVTNPTTNSLTYDVVATEDYNLWRVVSTGLQLKLLNADEENDGWWEAVRISQQFKENDYRLKTTGSSTNRTADGCIAPTPLLNVMKTKTIVNDPTYTTGRLRDIHKVQFNLVGSKDTHEFVRKQDAVALLGGGDDISAAPDITTNYECDFARGSQTAKDLIDQYIDPSYDMLYIRLHCRENSSTAATLNGSRMHMNLVSNQEVAFETGTKENRYHTPSLTIGKDACSIHCHARRSNRLAATFV